MTEEEKYQQIEAYLNGFLDQPEQVIFEQKIETDSDFKKLFNLQKKIHHSLAGEKTHAFRSMVSSVDKEWKNHNSTATTRILSLKNTLAIAASFLVLIFSIWFFTPKQISTDQELFATYFEPYSMTLNQRGDNLKEIENLQKAIEAYEAGQFENASTLFRTITAQSPDNQIFSFYLAQSELASNNTEEAILLFNKISKSNSPLITEQSQWYLSLAYLKSGQKEKAIPSLKQIQKGAFNYTESQQLLSRLKKQ